MELEIIGAFVVGAIIPLIAAVFGREPIGKLLLGKEKREDTALSALIDLAKEGIAGWRESNTAVMALSETMRQHQMQTDRSHRKMIEDGGDIAQAIYSMNGRLEQMDERLSTLIRFLGETGG